MTYKELTQQLKQILQEDLDKFHKTAAEVVSSTTPYEEVGKEFLKWVIAAGVQQNILETIEQLEEDIDHKDD